MTDIPRGTQDYLPGLSGADSERFTVLETLAATLFSGAGYQRVITPMFEDTQLFKRGVGESTDIVNKEMYTFEDRSGNSVTLRPDGTTPVMRAIVTNHLWDAGLPVKLWYSAAMFRYERPQKGRFRQHHQLGVEAVGSEAPELDAEVVGLGWELLQRAQAGEVTLLLNSMGHAGCREIYNEELRTYLQRYREQLDDDCKRRMEQNPLRVFDCKNPEDQALLRDAPTIDEYLCEDCRTHFAAVQRYLKDAGISFTLAPRLVRGFDYYTRTCFEYQSGALTSAQNALGGGGRYDRLVEMVGGPAMPGIGFGLGIERIMLAQEAAGTAAPRPVLDAFVIPLSDPEGPAAVEAVRALRVAGLRADMAYVSKGLKAHLKQANKIGARYAVLIGAKEREAGRTTVRDMTSGEQTEVGMNELAGWIGARTP